MDNPEKTGILEYTRRRKPNQQYVLDTNYHYIQANTKNISKT